MMEAAATCRRNMLSEIKIAIKPRLRTISDGIILWLRMGVGKKQLRLLRCLDVPIIIKYVVFALSLSFLFFIKPDISLIHSPSCITEIYLSVVDKDKYTCVL